MPTKTAPASNPTIEEASTEADEAAALVAALEERIRSGDPTVTPTELVNARSLAEFAGLQRDAAERRAHRANQTMVSIEVQSVIDAAQALAADRSAEHARLRANAVQAFAAYIDSVDSLAHDAGEVLSRLRAVNVRAVDVGVEATTASGVGELSGQLEVGDVVIPAGTPDGRRTLADVASPSGLDLWLEGGANTMRLTRKRPWPPES